jgi:uncharacterized protein
MKKIVIISDTHGRKANIEICLTHFKKINPDHVIHLGDNYDDAEPIIDAGYDVIRVPGLWTSYYQNPIIDNRIFWECEGWKLFLTHSRESHINDLLSDIKPEKIMANNKCDIFLFGHTHIPEITEKNNILFINPGHLKNNETKHVMSFAVLNLTNTQANVQILDLDMNTLINQTILNPKNAA